MLIKSITQKGDAVPLTAAEALRPAVTRACKACNTLDIIYWVDTRTVKETSLTSRADKDGVWEAWAEGTADIGKTITKTDEFIHPTPHTFKMHYKLSKDEWGIPDIEMVGIPELIPVERDPSKMVGPIPVAPPLTVPAAEALDAAKLVERSPTKAKKTLQEQT